MNRRSTHDNILPLNHAMIFHHHEQQTCIGIVHVLLTVARLGIAPYYLIYSVILMANFRIQQAYGIEIAFIGLALLGVSINEIISALLGSWSAKRHNKAILALVCD